MEDQLTFIKCINKCRNSSAPYGDVINLPLAKARIMEAMGNVEIIDEKVNPHFLNDSDYLYRCKFQPRRMTRVAWIQNYSKNGGAEISNFNAIRIGRNLGFDIIGYAIDDEDSFDAIKFADIVIVNNLHASGKEALLKKLYDLKKPWIKYEHDMQEEELEIFERSTLNVFISPMQMEYYISKVGEKIRWKSIYLPLAIDVSQWNAEEVKRIPESVLVPTYRKCQKNLATFMKSCPQYTYYVIGSPIPVGKNVVRIPQTDYAKMPDVYKKYQIVYHQPDIRWAGERVVFEAILSGCEVITNDNVGHTSWDFNWKDRDTLLKILPEAIYSFWRHVDAIVNNGIVPFGFNKTEGKKKTVSIVTRCMNRKLMLEQSIKTWIKIKEISEIIIVDWGAREDLSDLLALDDRIVILQCLHQKFFEMGRTRNVGVRFCKSDFVFMVDADVYFHDNNSVGKIIDKVVNGKLRDKVFITCGNDSCGGTSIIEKSAIDLVNGFVEGLPHWGQDDQDLYKRLCKSGYCRIIITGSDFLHIEHDDKLRFQNFKISDEKPLDELSASNKVRLARIDHEKRQCVPIKCNVIRKSGIEKDVVL